MGKSIQLKIRSKYESIKIRKFGISNGFSKFYRYIYNYN